MGLLREIQDAAIDEKVDVATALRRGMVLGMRLHHDALVNWVRRELGGYSSTEPLPEYRIVEGRAYGLFNFAHVSPRAHVTQTQKLIAPSDLPEQHRSLATQARFPQPIAVCQALIGEKTSATLDLRWPAELIRELQNDVLPGHRLIGATTQVSKSRLVGIADCVRNLLLELTLQVEREYPQAGELDSTHSEAPGEALTQVLNVTLEQGGVLNVAGHGAVQTVIQEIVPGDLERLKTYLSSQGVGSTDLQQLEDAIADDAQPEGPEHFGAKVSAWIGTMTGKAASGAWKLGSQVAVKLLTEAVKRYYGFGGPQ